MKRWVLGLGALALLGACGSGESSSSASAGSVTAAVATSAVATSAAERPAGTADAVTGAPTAGPRTFTDAKGRVVELPARPERVLALSEPSLDGALALGIVPVGTSSGRGQSGVTSYLAAYDGGIAAEIPIVAALAAPNLELIAAAQPDLIVIDGTSVNDDALIARLHEIAPTVWLSAPGDDWKVAFAALGEALGVADQAADVLAEYEARADAIEAELGSNAGAAVSIVRWGLTGPALILNELPASRVAADLGLTRPPEQDREGLGHSEPVSLERLDVIDADWIFFGSLGSVDGPATDQIGASASQVALASAVDTPGFTALTAYQNDRIVPVDGSVWTSAGGPISASLVLEDIATALT